MNKIKKVFIVGILICILSFMVSATDENTYIYEYAEQNLTVEFIENSAFSEDARQIIADSIAYDTPVPQTYSLCWLLGHDYYVEVVSATYHKKSVYAPRCLIEFYDVTQCRKCDYIYPVFTGSQYIHCCPPEASAVSIDDSHTH